MCKKWYKCCSPLSMPAGMERDARIQVGAWNHGLVPDQFVGHSVGWPGLCSLALVKTMAVFLSHVIWLWLTALLDWIASGSRTCLVMHNYDAVCTANILLHCIKDHFYHLPRYIAVCCQSTCSPLGKPSDSSTENWKHSFISPPKGK